MKQDYGAHPVIEGILVEPLFWHYAPDGQFCELKRETFYHADQEQLNLSILQPGATKALHLHENQDDRFYCWQPLLVGLKDMRLDSPTFNLEMKLMLCNESLYVPRGVAHGLKNLNPFQVHLVYTVNNFFDGTDEGRLPYDLMEGGASFWEMLPG